MKTMENGVFGVTKLISKSKEGQVVMDINQICELNDYQESTLRTWNNKTDFGGRVSNAALGLTGEAGEVADIVKKAIYHGHGFQPSHCPGEEDGNTYKLALELGNTMYYVSIMAHELGYTLQDIAEMNIAKLAKRYPDGFSREASQARVDVK
ncbi:nucleotide pyrophosphohydrolase [Bacillus thuringiensis serovar shandongiensis]|uniref:nucleoside triphosphate pyrophosphohydrolase family protein n=1 Tax=Bacillus toyonensis TaxID=155322 RepID=UPI000B447DA4|nr:nucleoside triphosphate pyrophosphohydrolase family protein [Bacillus toyonensis]MBX0352153.1 nucleoside triphosphate pyrophosphohydrolase family protein [Bacillus toyonensis]OTX40169.1 nucleotide pyrophosphohydrolase [Bacillus thuringiensis serovar malayensis]OUB05352.1 nucleotide pyrophosphohydrolase [Bacillus thuringiensis serovar shandongiensis]